MRAPRSASAVLRSSTPSARATTVSECSLASRTRSSTVPSKVLAPRSDGCRNQRLEENSACGSALWGRTLNQPLTPHASAMRPTSMASAGSSAASMPAGSVDAAGRRGAAIEASGGGGSRGCDRGVLQQAFHGGGSLRADATPVGEAVLRDAQLFLAILGQRVVETQALDEAAITTHALVGDDDVVERTGLGTATGESNDDHDLSLGG